MRRFVVASVAMVMLGCSAAAWADKAPPARKPTGPATQPTTQPVPEPRPPKPLPVPLPIQPAE